MPSSGQLHQVNDYHISVEAITAFDTGMLVYSFVCLPAFIEKADICKCCWKGHLQPAMLLAGTFFRSGLWANITN